MAISYKKLWHILLDRDMKKKDLERYHRPILLAVRRNLRNLWQRCDRIQLFDVAVPWFE